MKMLKLIVLGAFLLGGLALNAQTDNQKKSPQEKADRLTEKLTQELGLDETKSAKLSELNQTLFVSLAAVHDDESMSKEDKKATFKTKKEAYRNDLKALLSAEEFAKYEEFEAKKQAQREAIKSMKNKSPQDRADMQTKYMVENLDDLTQDQIEKIAELNLRVEEKIEAIRTDDGMSEEKKKEFIEGNRQDQRNTLEMILTAEQLAQLKALKEAKKAQHEK